MKMGKLRLLVWFNGSVHNGWYYPLIITLLMTTEFALDLRLARRKAGLTQRDCAHLLAIHPGTLSTLEHGSRLPTVMEICTLSLIYGRSFESLFAGIMREARLDLLRRLETISETARQCVATMNRDVTLTRLRQRLQAELADHAA